MAISALLLLIAARGDLWLDEIWSIDFARAARVPSEILSFHHDNNHVLNTLYLFAVRSAHTALVFRMFAIASGVGIVMLAGSVALEWGAIERVASMALLAFSYPLVIYGSEARGYAPAMFFALLAYRILRRYRFDDRLLPAAAFWIVCVLGLLSHLTFAMAIIAFAAGSLAYGGRRPMRIQAMRQAVYHAPPLLFLAWWSTFFGTGMVFGRGPVYRWSDVIGRATILLLGFPDAPALRIAGIAAVVVIVLAGSVVLRRRGDDSWLFYPVMCLACPALFLVVMQPRYLYFRYFVVCFPFVYLLLGYLIARAATAETYRWLVAVVAVVVLSTHIARIARLVRIGRGQYRAALRMMVTETRGNVLRVGSDDDIANGVVLRFYSSELPPSMTIHYVSLALWPREPPEWFIYHTQRTDEEPAPGLILRGAGAYRFVQRYPFEGTSGWQWFVFRRASAPGGVID